MTIQVNNTEIRIRPSSIDTFYNCAYQWGKVFLEGVITIPNARAAIGTSIHAGVEQMWTEAMKHNRKMPSLGAMTDAAMIAWKEENANGMRFDEGENDKTATVEIIQGIEAFVEDVTPFAPIPVGVEEFFEIPIDSTIVKAVGGTVDYRAPGIIADVKTSKRKPVPESYKVQQSTYKFLAEQAGHKVEYNYIHGIVLKKEVEGMILPLETNVDQARTLINGIIEVTELIAKDTVSPDIILRGNPKYYLCDPKYCSLYPCKFVKGEA